MDEHKILGEEEEGKMEKRRNEIWLIEITNVLECVFIFDIVEAGSIELVTVATFNAVI